jgi:actin-related protein 6
MVFEDWEFAAYYRCIGIPSSPYPDSTHPSFAPSNLYLGPTLNAWNDLHPLFNDPVTHPQDSPPLPVECCLIIDSGYSHTTVTPVYNGQPLHRAIRRLDIGGKFLTNYLKEIISIRHYNLMDETYLTNEVKETVCFVSDDFARDLGRTWKGAGGKKNDPAGEGISVDYFLPDYNGGLKTGYMKPHDPELVIKKRMGLAGTGDVVDNYMTLGNERFTVPELLFSPGDVGMKQAGIHEMVMQSLSKLPTGLWPVMLANVFVVGGNAKIAGFMERLCVFSISKTIELSYD